MKYLTLIIIITVFYSCDTRQDMYFTNNIAPTIKIKKISDSEFTNYIRDSLKLNFNRFIYEYEITNENTNYIYEVTKDYGTGNIIDSSIYKIYTPINEGDVIIVNKVTDIYNRWGSANIYLTVFENLNPVCNIEIEETNIFTQMEFVIDLSDSYDKDARFGGKIILYEYKIGDNYFIQSSHNQINYIFESPGTYVIKVRVKDNNDVWSDQKIKIVNVNQSK